MTKISQGLHTLDTMLDLNNHANQDKMILKVDIEGAEWDFLQEIKINKTHQAIWVHANCIGGVLEYPTVKMPQLLEITFVNKKEYTLIPTEYICPTELDFPNNGQKDICLKGWGSK